MRRGIPLMAIAILLATLGLAVSVASAESPHFTWTYPGICPQTGGIAVQFQEAGLGTNDGVDLQVTANATGKYECNGTQTMTWTVDDLTTVPVPVYVPRYLKPANPATSDKNGQVDGWLFYPRSWPTPWPTCDGVPTQWSQVTYEDIHLIDAEHDVDLSLGDMTRTLFMPLQ